MVSTLLALLLRVTSTAVVGILSVDAMRQVVGADKMAIRVRAGNNFFKILSLSVWLMSIFIIKYHG